MSLPNPMCNSALKKSMIVLFIVLVALVTPAESIVSPRSKGGSSSWAVACSSSSRSGATCKAQLQSLRGGAAPSLRLSPEALALAETLAPKVGVLTSTILYFAPAMSVLQALKKDEIGDLNPLPLAIMSVVSVSWLVYGLMVQDPYVYLSNIAGCIVSVGYVLAVLPLFKEEKAKLRLTQGVVLSGAASVLCLWTYLGLVGASLERITSSLGYFASGLVVLFSASPLSSVRTVVATRNASSILGPLTAAQVINTSLWTMYGFAVDNPFVWGPNLIGWGLGIVQLALKLCFPSKAMPKAKLA